MPDSFAGNPWYDAVFAVTLNLAKAVLAFLQRDSFLYRFVDSGIGFYTFFGLHAVMWVFNLVRAS